MNSFFGRLDAPRPLPAGLRWTWEPANSEMTGDQKYGELLTMIASVCLLQPSFLQSFVADSASFAKLNLVIGMADDVLSVSIGLGLGALVADVLWNHGWDETTETSE